MTGEHDLLSLDEWRRAVELRARATAALELAVDAGPAKLRALVHRLAEGLPVYDMGEPSGAVARRPPTSSKDDRFEAIREFARDAGVDVPRLRERSASLRKEWAASIEGLEAHARSLPQTKQAEPASHAAPIEVQPRMTAQQARHAQARTWIVDAREQARAMTAKLDSLSAEERDAAMLDDGPAWDRARARME